VFGLEFGINVDSIEKERKEDIEEIRTGDLWQQQTLLLTLT
jgi:hypothetical protein